MKNLMKSFGYAFHGIYKTLKYERNMRIHFVCMIYMYSFLLFSDFFAVTRTQLAILFLTNALVIAAELLNTAVERAVDLACGGMRDDKAKLAKDAAAGAVLVCAIFAVAVGIAVLWQPEAFRVLWAYFSENLLRIALFVASIAVATVFIFKGFSKNGMQDNSVPAQKEKE